VTNAPSIALIDYGVGNVPSVERALQKLGASTKRVTQPSEFATARAIILPGVGHYNAIIRGLDENNLRAAVLETIAGGIPFLGICLGLQSLYSCSEEAPSLTGLNLFGGSVRSLPTSVKLPHMGWNRIRMQRSSQLLEGLTESDYFYFAHSFAAETTSAEVVATCEHGAAFAAVIEQGNIFATQFHPEKSGAAGARLLANFARLAA
jgi:imidazole glycerol phosphate synthase glutamine amidotransferase subunit